MWSAGEFEIFVSRLLGQTALTRAVRAKLMRPISFFSAGTVEPTIGLIVRFTGDIAANELAGLNARLLIGTNEHRLTLKHSGGRSSSRCFHCLLDDRKKSGAHG